MSRSTRAARYGSAPGHALPALPGHRSLTPRVLFDTPTDTNPGVPDMASIAREAAAAAVAAMQEQRATEARATEETARAAAAATAEETRINDAVQTALREAGVGVRDERNRPDLGGTRVDVTVGDDRSTRWQRRAARWFLAHIRLGSNIHSDREEGARMLATLAEETLNVSDARAAAEAAEARTLLDGRVLDLAARHRCRGILENYEEALHDLRAVPADRRGGQTPLVDASVRTMSTLTDTAGGYLVPTPMLAELLVFIEEYGYVRSLFRTVNMTSDTLEWKKVGTKPVAAWYGELERITASDMTFGDGGLSTSKLAGITSWSKELQEDAMVALLPTYIQLMGEAMAEKEDLAGIKGDGTATYGGFRGVLDLGAADGASVYTMGSGDVSLANINLEDLLAASKAVTKSRRRGAKWLLSESTVTALVTLKKNNEANNYILLDPNNPARIAGFLGYPLVDPEGIEDSFFPTNAAGTAFGAFGDFSRSIFGIRRGMTVETSDTAVLNDAAGAVTLNAMQQDAVIAKVTERVAIGHPQPDAYVILKTAAS